MTNPSIYDEMKALNDEILYLNDRFHNHNEEPIPNSEFDKKQERFDELCELYPDVAKAFVHHQKAVPLIEVTNEGLGLVEFDEPMLSLKKKLNQKDLDEWLNSFPPGTYWIREYKLDGLALELLYIDRKLVQMATRGDGNVGEDVTHSIPLFRNIPLKLPKSFPATFSVRGEGVMSFATFEAYNAIAEKPLVTPRNGVSGWVRRLERNQDPNTFGMLDFFVYGASNRLEKPTYEAMMLALEEKGFEPSPWVSMEDVRADKKSDKYPVDGVVFKLDWFDDQDRLGSNNKHPLWAIAYKFPDVEVEVAYSHTVWATGKTGRVNPTLYFHPAIVGGVTCQRASIDNYHQFMALGLRDDTLLAVTRNGDVIPRVRRVIDSGVGERVKAPDTCPSCGSKLRLKTSDNSAFLYCDNVTGCKSQLLNRCLALVSRGCLDIDGLGPVILSKLIDEGKVEYPADILRLSPADINASVWSNIMKVQTVPLHKVILAMGLPGVDVIRAKNLARAVNVAGIKMYPPELAHWLGNKDNLVKIHRFGEKIADPIASALETDMIQLNADRLFEQLIPFYKEDATERKICITGEVGLPREGLIDLLALAGIELVSNLTKDCQLLLVGEKPGEKKLLKATALDIPMVTIARVSSVEDLIAQINNHS
jgi:DNA ligase (NAD+)